MSRILRRPLFRGGSANEGVMSVPRKGYADPDEDGVQPEEDNIIETVASSQGDTSRDKMLQQLLADRPDPLGKFLIDFGLDLMSRPASRGKFGFLTTAAKAAKAPTKQLYSDLDTYWNLLPAFWKASRSLTLVIVPVFVSFKHFIVSSMFLYS